MAQGLDAHSLEASDVPVDEILEIGAGDAIGDKDLAIPG